MGKNLLVLGIGDSEPSDRNIKRTHEYALSSGIRSIRADYHQIGSLPKKLSGKIYIMPFFPFTFWNKNCEIPSDTELYGTSNQSYRLFSEFLSEKKAELEKKFGKERLEFIIDLEKAAVDRDKDETKRILRKNGVRTPDDIPYKNTQDVIDAIGDNGIFIKCRYGAEGKGITYLSKSIWATNYRVLDGHLGNYGVYDNWMFSNITGRKDLLDHLLSHAITVEREICPPDSFDGMKFDVRVYSIFHKATHAILRLNKPENLITNVSQGASVRHHPHTGLNRKCLMQCHKLATESSQAMGLNILGVDVMFDGEIGKVIEVQTFTGFPDIRAYNLAKHIVQKVKDMP